MKIIPALVLPVLASARPGNSRVLLRDVTALTLRKGEYTNYRRVSPVQQLACTRGCDSRSIPDEIQCVNVGFDGFDVNWKCEADLPMGAKLTNVNIQCEGYEHPDDPYILAGSCGATYELVQSKYAYLDEDGSDRRHPRDSYRETYRDPVVYDSSQSDWSWPGLLMIAFIGFIFYNIFCGSSASGRGAQSTASGAGDSWWSRPRAGWGSGWGLNPFGGGGGFLSGLGLGSMMGSMWGRPRRTGWGWGGGGWGGGGWGGGGWGARHYGGANYSTGGYGTGYGSSGSDRSGLQYSSGQRSSGRSTDRQTSTSYATTSRR